MPISSPRFIHQFAHLSDTAVEAAENGLADQEMADVQLDELRDGGDWLDIFEGQPMAGMGFDAVFGGEGRGIGDLASPVTGELPNRILLYRRPILDYWAEHEETLGSLVSHVLIHEIGHHFGLSDEDMEALEDSVA